MEIYQGRDNAYSKTVPCFSSIHKEGYDTYNTWERFGRVRIEIKHQ